MEKSIKKQLNSKYISIVDIETSGYLKDGGEIIEISAIKFCYKNDNYKKMETFSERIKPENMHIKDDAYKVNNINVEELENKPSIKEVLPEYIDFIKDTELVGHRAGFDIEFIREEIKKYNFEIPDNNVYCTSEIGKLIFQREDLHLKDLLEIFQIDDKTDGYTNKSLKDCYKTGRLFFAMIDKHPDINYKPESFNKIKFIDEWWLYKSNYLQSTNKILEELKKRPDFLGLYGYGSFFELQRTPSATSDLDLIAVVGSNIWEFHVFAVDGVEAELFIIGVDRILSNVMCKDNRFEIRNIGSGRIIYSNHNIVPIIKQLAEERYFKLGAFPLDKLTLFLKRVSYSDWINKVKNNLHIDSIFLMHYVFERLVEDWFNFARKYYEKPTYHFSDIGIKHKDKFMMDKCYEYLNEKDNEQRVIILEEILNHCLKYIGGPPDKEWSIKWIPPIIEEEKNSVNVQVEKSIWQSQNLKGKNREQLINKCVDYYKSKNTTLAILNTTGYYKMFDYMCDPISLFIWSEELETIIGRKCYEDNIMVFYEQHNLRNTVPKFLLYRDSGLIKKLANAEILYCNDNRAKLMIQLAKSFANVPSGRGLRQGQIILKRKRSGHFLEDSAKYIKKEPAVGLYVMNMVFYYQVNNFYTFNKFIKPDWIETMKDLEKRDNYLYGLCEKYLLNEDLEYKLGVLEKIVNYVIEPFGGFVPERFTIPEEPTFRMPDDILSGVAPDKEIADIDEVWHE